MKAEGQVTAHMGVGACVLFCASEGVGMDALGALNKGREGHMCVLCLPKCTDVHRYVQVGGRGYCDVV